MKISAVFWGILFFSWGGKADLSADNSFEEKAPANGRSLLLSLEKKTGETEMNQALAAGDIEGFRQALFRGLLKKTAMEFFKDWWTVTEEGNTIFHQLALAEASSDKSGPAAFYLLSLARALSFPEKKRAEPYRINLGGLYLFEPLEKTDLAKAIVNNFKEKKFYDKLGSLLSQPAWKALAALHAVTWSQKTLRGLVDESRLSYKETGVYLREIQLLEWLFVRPILEPNNEGLTPLDVARANGGNSYYALRSILGDGQKEIPKDLFMLTGAAGVLGVEAYTIFSPGSLILSRLAADWGMSAIALGEIAFYGPPAIAAAGIACYHAFKAKRQKGIIQKLESL